MSTLVVNTAQQPGSEEMTGMSFLQHLDELRRRIIYGFLYIVAGLGICWGFHERIFAIMEKPIMAALANHHLD
jgi:sec-independent protein translocase protein TatC